jgi:hypothetical protein
MELRHLEFIRELQVTFLAELFGIGLEQGPQIAAVS